MKLPHFIKTSATALVVLAASSTAALADFPERTIELIHPWGPGNAMSVSQIIANAMGDELGVDMPVISNNGHVQTR
jgi:tripartite-type tricarboxylate transporter receptor subunit TctC